MVKPLQVWQLGVTIGLHDTYGVDNYDYGNVDVDTLVCLAEWIMAIPAG